MTSNSWLASEPTSDNYTTLLCCPTDPQDLPLQTFPHPFLSFLSSGLIHSFIHLSIHQLIYLSTRESQTRTQGALMGNKSFLSILCCPLPIALGTFPAVVRAKWLPCWELASEPHPLHSPGHQPKMYHLNNRSITVFGSPSSSEKPRTRDRAGFCHPSSCSDSPEPHPRQLWEKVLNLES